MSTKKIYNTIVKKDPITEGYSEDKKYRPNNEFCGQEIFVCNRDPRDPVSRILRSS